jgi:molybdenum cofactor biosynthesis protein B
MNIPHDNEQWKQINCATFTISDSRTPSTDKSGKLIQELLIQFNHQIVDYQIIKDEPKEIELLLQKIAQSKSIDVIIFNGGTGISPRDNTYDILASMLEKTLFGFGEIFRFLSYQEIGSRAIASRAIAGIYQRKLVFSLPGSTRAVSLGMEKLILPELIHLVTQINQF